MRRSIRVSMKVLCRLYSEAKYRLFFLPVLIRTNSVESCVTDYGLNDRLALFKANSKTDDVQRATSNTHCVDSNLPRRLPNAVSSVRIIESRLPNESRNASN